VPYRHQPEKALFHLDLIEKLIASIKPESVIVGGDFNAPLKELPLLSANGNFLNGLKRVDLGPGKTTSMNYGLSDSYLIDHVLMSKD